MFVCVCVAPIEPDEGINWLEYLMEGVEIPSFTSDVESEVCNVQTYSTSRHISVIAVGAVVTGSMSSLV